MRRLPLHVLGIALLLVAALAAHDAREFAACGLHAAQCGPGGPDYLTLALVGVSVGAAPWLATGAALLAGTLAVVVVVRVLRPRAALRPRAVRLLVARVARPVLAAPAAPSTGPLGARAPPAPLA